MMNEDGWATVEFVTTVGNVVEGWMILVRVSVAYLLIDRLVYEKSMWSTITKGDHTFLFFNVPNLHWYPVALCDDTLHDPGIISEQATVAAMQVKRVNEQQCVRHEYTSTMMTATTQTGNCQGMQPVDYQGLDLATDRLPDAG
ncbi:unnamed protein product [Soboliphyme baturini]|uniref:Agenet domain-containing protein n=1 Tax=Soboliphyme baturini TaxID=241478 RepID=A0A183J1J1_9BILA|nr:unnamed protein product [Soboliphyme baturini]